MVRYCELIIAYLDGINIEVLRGDICYGTGKGK